MPRVFSSQPPRETATADGLPSTDALLAETILLLSRAATLGVCRGRLRRVIQHLHRMVDQPSVAPAVRSTCLQVLQDWHEAQQTHFPELPSTPLALHTTQLS